MRRATNSTWRGKLHPVFFELASLNKEFTEHRLENEKQYTAALKTLGPNAALEAKAEALEQQKRKDQELMDWANRKLLEIDQLCKDIPETPLGFPWLKAARKGPIDNEMEELGVSEWLHAERHGEPLTTAITQASKGDLGALRRIHRTEEDIFRLKHGKTMSTNLQGDPFHRDLLSIGLCFGLETLTSEELADCFDEYCPCKKVHDAAALKQQRYRLLREFRNASIK